MLPFSMALVMALPNFLFALQAGSASADAAGLGGDFVAISPSVVLLDTRSGAGGTSGVRGPGSTTTFAVLGQAGVPAEGVTAVLVDLEAISPTVSTYLTIWPDGDTRPALSMVNVAANQTLSNSAVVAVGANGRIAVYNQSGNTHIAVDVQGYFTGQSGGSGGGFVATVPTRLVDTRTGLGTTTGAGTIAPGSSRTVTLTGDVVPSGAAVAFLDVIVTGATGQGHIRAAPAGATSSRSLMEYPAGTTSHAVSVPFAANGQATFSNHGTSTIHLVLTAQGYATANASSGAGLRILPATRLIDTRDGGGAAVPANGTIDLAIGGVNGLPTRAIAGAVLNLTAVNPSGTGYLTAWPLGGTVNPTSMTTFSSSQSSRSGLAIVPVGDEGKIRIRNASNGTVHVLADLQGWLADPLPVVPLVPNTRTSVLQLTPPQGATYGAVQFAYVDNLGRLLYGHQADPNLFGSIQWSTISGNEAFGGPPALGQLPDGRVQIAAQFADSNIRSIAQSAVGVPGWNPWSQLGGSMAAPPVIGRLSTGTTVIFAVDVDGRLWHYRQQATTPSWQSLGDADLTGGLTVGPASNGLRIMAVGASGTVKTAVYANDGALSAWTDLGGAGFSGTPALVVYPGHRARVFVRDSSGTIVTKLQDPSGSFPSTWNPLDGLTVVGSPTAILDPVYGRVAVAARSADNLVHVVWETAVASGNWGNWSVPSGFSTPSVVDPTAAPYTYIAGERWILVGRDINGQLIQALGNVPPGSRGQAELARGGVRP